MFTSLFYSFLLFAILGLVQCHTEIIRVNGGIVGLQTIRERSPVKEYQDPEMFCGLGPKKSSGPLSLKAGDIITLDYLNTGRAPEFLDPSHQGPCMAYIAEAATPNKFSKIFEEGYDDSGVSCNSQISKTGTLSFKLPSNLKSGTYILRMELIALHEADGLPPARGAQFYIQCVDIKISGPANGVGVGANAVSIPGHVKQDTPGVQFNVYTGKKITNYPIPGPAVDSTLTIESLTLTHPKSAVVPLPPSKGGSSSSPGGSSSSPGNSGRSVPATTNFSSSSGFSSTGFIIFGAVILALPLVALAILFRS